MTKVLSLRNKLRSNKLGIIRQTVTVAIIVSLCYLLAIIINTEISSISTGAFTSANFSVRPAALVDFENRLTENGLEYRVVYTQDNISYTDIMFLYYKFSILMVEDVEDFIDFSGGGTMVEGRLPQKSNELLLDLNIARNNHLTIGDKFHAGTISGGTGDLGELTVVGIYQSATSDWRASFVLKDAATALSEFEDTLSVTVRLKMEEFDAFIANDIETLLSGFPKDSVIPQSNFGSVKQIENNRRSFVSIMAILFAFVFFVSAFCLFHTSSIHLYHRSQEYQVLSALGHRKNEILLSIYREYLFINLVGWLAGFIAATIAVYALNALVWIPNGTPALYFSPYGASFTLIGVLFLCLTNVLPIKKVLRGTAVPEI